MILPLVASIYILAGGSIAGLLVTSADHNHPFTPPFNPAAAFTLVVGTIVLWPVLLALAAAQGSTK